MQVEMEINHQVSKMNHVFYNEFVFVQNAISHQ